MTIVSGGRGPHLDSGSHFLTVRGKHWRNLSPSVHQHVDQRQGEALTLVSSGRLLEEAALQGGAGAKGGKTGIGWEKDMGGGSLEPAAGIQTPTMSFLPLVYEFKKLRLLNN